MFKRFEKLVSKVDAPEHNAESGPPASLLGFYWHFVKQTKWLYAAMLLTGLAVALVDLLIPVFIGRMVSLMTATDRTAALAEQMPMLLGMALLILIGRPVVVMLDSLIRNNAVLPGVTTLIRWQSHWHVLRQSWAFFQNDFAGRIANRVMNTANSLRESVVASIRAVWYILGCGKVSVRVLTRGIGMRC